MTLTIFYDGTCPLCVAEMNLLHRHDGLTRLNLEDIHSEAFDSRYPQVDKDAASTVLHGMDDKGVMMYGLDVTVRAWSLVGKKRWLKVLRWPGIRWFADKVYLWFAKNRYTISYIFTGQKTCSNGICQNTLKTKTPNRNCARSVNEDAEF